jgi:hypothetical protein
MSSNKHEEVFLLLTPSLGKFLFWGLNARFRVHSLFPDLTFPTLACKAVTSHSLMDRWNISQLVTYIVLDLLVPRALKLLVHWHHHYPIAHNPQHHSLLTPYC